MHPACEISCVLNKLILLCPDFMTKGQIHTGASDVDSTCSGVLLTREYKAGQCAMHVSAMHVCKINRFAYLHTKVCMRANNQDLA